jgi:hypothetical protein
MYQKKKFVSIDYKKKNICFYFKTVFFFYLDTNVSQQTTLYYFDTFYQIF